MTVINSDSKKAWIEKPIKPHVFNIVHGMPDRRKFKDGVPYFEMTRANVEYLDSVLGREASWNGPVAKMRGEFHAIRELEKSSRESLGKDLVVEDFPFKLPPYKHQSNALARARRKRAFGYFMEQGTGKTKTLLDDGADLFLIGEIDTIIIVAPNGVHAQWVNEQVPTHLSPVVNYRAAYTAAAPTPEERRNMSETLSFKGGLRIIAIHIDSLSHPKGKAFLRELLLGSRALLVVDESSRIKDGNSKRTKTLIELGKLAAYRRILTGTPVSQGPEDLYSQFEFLDPNILGYSSFFAFRNHFCRMGGFQNKKIVGYVNEDELVRKIDSHTYRVLKDDCLDLPERNYIPRQVLMTSEQWRVYKELRKNFFTELDSGVLTAKMAMQRIIRFQQIVNGFIWQNEKKDPHSGRIVSPFMYQEFDQNRVQAALDIIEEAKGDTKLIVWIKFQGDFKLLTEAFEKQGISYVPYVGSTPKEDRVPNINKFRDDPNVKVFLSTPKSGGIGLNLTAASEVIWFSRDFSLENELQANDRVHRIGQRKVVNVHQLISPGTVDEKIDKMLRAKKTVAENLIDLRELMA